MPRVPLHVLTWSSEQRLYELYIQGQLEQRFRPAEESAWLAWLSNASSFAFHGEASSLNVYREARPRGGSYWYAYHTTGRRTRKRYLGSSAQVTFARLEETTQALARASTSSSPAASPMRSPTVQPLLLSSKLAPPRLPNALVERERLQVELDGALLTPLTLLAAPAGWGKTTLLTAWASRHRAQVAWLSLDELDTSPTRFWVSLIAALRHCGRCGPSIGETAVALLESPQSPLAACLSALLQDLDSHEALSTPLVLIVDDYHLISDPALHESLSFFLEHLPVHLHLILASRMDPDLPLARLRTRGHLTEIRTDELRFRLEEASHYLGQMLSPMLSDEEVQQLVNRTEGWIAGLQLAALSLQKREDRAAFLQALSGSQRYLLDYVQEEILARLPTSVRDFLLSTSILSRLDASMCQAVTAEPERRTSQQMLVLLERTNLFVVPLDEERRSYRLHELFREALLACLQTTQPERVPVLHRRAADFYEAKGEWSEAITHALAAADFSTATRLMEQTVEQFWEHGEAATMASWVRVLPEPLVREHARLVLTTALYLLNTVPLTTGEQRTRVHQQVRQLIARVETALLPPQADETGPSGPIIRAGALIPIPSESKTFTEEEALLQRRLRLLRAGMALYEALTTGEEERLNTLHQEMQELDQDEEVIWQMFPLFCSFTLHYALKGEGAVLVPRLLEAKERVSQSGSHFAIIRVRQWLAMAQVEAGHLRLAYEESLAALYMIEQMAGYALLKGYFEAVLMMVLYQWNQLEEVRGRLRTVMQDAATWQQSDLLLSGYLTLMQVELARGDLSAFQQTLDEFEQLEAYKGSAYHWRWLPTIRAQGWLAQGQLRKAADWTASIVFPQEVWDGPMYSAFQVVVQVYFAQHRWREVLELLDNFSTHLDRPANVRITITYLSQSLIALHQAGQSEEARLVAARLFALTEPEGSLRVYLDLGQPMKQALKMLLSVPPDAQSDAASASFSRSYVLRLLAIFEQEESIAAHHTPHAGSPRALIPESLLPLAEGWPLHMEPLSPQEFKVLHLLVAGRTYAEMAESLIVSIHTIKTQISSIYRKLGVNRRAEAIAASRRFHLL